MKIGVVGAGAIGCWVGGRLAVTEDVVFVGRERVKRDLETNGLTAIDSAGGTDTVRIAAADVRVVVDPATLADRDVVLVCVKSAQTEEVAKDLARVLGARKVLVASMQNGVRNADMLREHLGETHVVLGGIVEFNVVAKDGGEYRRTTTGSLVFERADDARLGELVTALDRARIGHIVAKDIRAIQWSKLMMNVNNAVGALTDVPTQRLVFEEPYRRIVRALIEESLRVLGRAGVKPSRLGPLPPALFPYLLRLPSPLVKILSRVQVAIDPEARSSMWDDLTRRRLTEVDFLNGEIVRLAGSCGAEAPLNAQIVRLVHEAEQAAEGSPKLSARELWNALHAPS